MPTASSDGVAGSGMTARVMDEAYGKILRALDEEQLPPNTLVCCFTDHGLQFPRNMCNLTDHGIGVYLIICGPGGFNETSGGAGRVADRLANLVDLFPTVCDVAGLEAPTWLQGRSLLPLADDDAHYYFLDYGKHGTEERFDLNFAYFCRVLVFQYNIPVNYSKPPVTVPRGATYTERSAFLTFRVGEYEAHRFGDLLRWTTLLRRSPKLTIE